MAEANEIHNGEVRRLWDLYETEVKMILREEVKRKAKVMLIGYVPRDAPLENLCFFYECGRKYGKISGEPGDIRGSREMPN